MKPSLEVRSYSKTKISNIWSFFVYYKDDLISKDHDWELFDRLSLRKRQNRINLNAGPLFEILVKH
ncbi:hypothetical protein Lser_V15G20828 [Lactuca serriola]